MQVNFRDLTIWSFLMATAHGAGLMLVPILVHLPPGVTSHVAHEGHANHRVASATTIIPTAELAAVAVHTGAMFLVMGVIAVVVYEKVGLAILRRAGFNLDRVWAVVLLVAGALTFVL
jgi:hypothetical protein